MSAGVRCTAPAAIDNRLLPAEHSAANHRLPLLLSSDGTDRRTLDRYTDPAPHTMQAVSIKHYNIFIDKNT